MAAAALHSHTQDGPIVHQRGLDPGRRIRVSRLPAKPPRRSSAREVLIFVISGISAGHNRCATVQHLAPAGQGVSFQRKWPQMIRKSARMGSGYDRHRRARRFQREWDEWNANGHEIGEWDSFDSSDSWFPTVSGPEATTQACRGNWISGWHANGAGRMPSQTGCRLRRDPSTGRCVSTDRKAGRSPGSGILRR
jgi:hypothetical protein